MSPSRIIVNETTDVSHSNNETSTWDSPRYIPPNVLEENENSSNFDPVMKVVKLLVYLISFLIVITGSSLNQLSFIVIGAQMQLNEQKSTRILWNMIGCFTLAFPKLMLFFKCLLQRGKDKPFTLHLFMFVTVVEVLSAIGDCLWIFQILPQTPSILVPMGYLGLGWMPCLLSLLSYNMIRSSHIRYAYLIIKMFASICLMFIPLYMYFLISINDHHSAGYSLLLTLSLFFSSIRWWGSYFAVGNNQSKEFSNSIEDQHTVFKLNLNCICASWNKIKQLLTHMVIDLEDCRYRVYTYISIFQLFIYSLLCNALLPSSIRFNKTAYSDAFGQISTINPYFCWIIISAFGSYLVYLTSKNMCKISMQLFSFALPFTLTSIVVSVLIYIWEYGSETFVSYSLSYVFSSKLIEWGETKIGHKIGYWFIIILLTICQSIACSHIFTQNQDKYSRGDNLFIIPFYDGISIVQSMIFNRKQLDDAVHVQFHEHENIVPKIYLCATMWHETVDEMQQLFVSIFRTDLEQMVISKQKQYEKTKIHEEYDFEVHILFDDAFETKFNRETNQYERVVNKYVKGLVTAIYNATNVVFKTNKTILCRPTRFVTPYGGQLVWMTPANKPIVVHLKDKTKIRNKKRWSQIMYLYYLLTYKIPLQMKESQDNNQTNIYIPYRDLLMPSCLHRLNNTFILMLDGDIDWKPVSIRILLNDLLKNEKTGAVCARIMPSGPGPIVWYQMIEYAVQHWLAKTMENAFGCVLCTPGCFSLYRASALLDDNVMKAYSKIAVEASELVQYDQGEDRWLCTLLLQCRSGYRVNYCASSWAIASSPITFAEFLNQRRRWIPSSLINHFDFIKNGWVIAKHNKNIPFIYVIMQALLFISNITAPAFIIIYMSSALSFTNINLIVAYAIIIIPVFIHLIICLTCKKDTQIRTTAIISLFLALFFIMAIATSIFAVIHQSNNYANYFIVFISGTTVFAALIHPFETFNLLFLPLYITATPVMFLLFFNYALCNINDMGWGTREAAAAKDVPAGKNILLRTIDAFLKLWEAWIESKMNVRQTESVLSSFVSPRDEQTQQLAQNDNLANLDSASIATQIDQAKEQLAMHSRDPKMSWCENDREIQFENNDELYTLIEEDNKFWKEFIAKYLTPLDLTNKDKETLVETLNEFRNKVIIGYSCLTALLVVAQYQIAFIGKSVNSQLNIPLGQNYLRVDYLTLTLIVFYAIQILLQVIGMLYHRMGTLMEYLFITKLRQSNLNQYNYENVINEQYRVSPTQNQRRLTIINDRMIPSYQVNLHHNEANPENTV